MKNLKENQILGEVEKTLLSFDNDSVLEENPFLYTRIKAEKDIRNSRSKKNFALRFGFSQALVLLILLINIVTVVYYYERNAKQNMQDKLVLELRHDFQIEQSQSSF